MTKEKDKERFFELLGLLLQCDTANEFNEVNKEMEVIEDNYDKETLSKWLEEIKCK